jgi:hypothetical protein
VEDLAFDRAALEHMPFGGLELVEASSEQRLDRGRNLDLVTVRRATDEREHLLHVERVAAGRAPDSRVQAAVEGGAFQ